jgi:uncharacterized protein YukE
MLKRDEQKFNETIDNAMKRGCGGCHGYNKLNDVGRKNVESFENYKRIQQGVVNRLTKELTTFETNLNVFFDEERFEELIVKKVEEESERLEDMINENKKEIDNLWENYHEQFEKHRDEQEEKIEKLQKTVHALEELVKKLHRRIIREEANSLSNKRYNPFDDLE